MLAAEGGSLAVPLPVAVGAPAGLEATAAAIAELASSGIDIAQLLAAVASDLTASRVQPLEEAQRPRLPARAHASPGMPAAAMKAASAEGRAGDAADEAAAAAAEEEEEADEVGAEEAARLAAEAAASAAAASAVAEAAALVAAAAAAAARFADAATECERLEQCGQELAAAQRALLVAEGKGPTADLSPFRLRCAAHSHYLCLLPAAAAL